MKKKRGMYIWKVKFCRISNNILLSVFTTLLNIKHIRSVNRETFSFRIFKMRVNRKKKFWCIAYLLLLHDATKFRTFQRFVSYHVNVFLRYLFRKKKITKSKFLQSNSGASLKLKPSADMPQIRAIIKS